MSISMIFMHAAEMTPKIWSKIKRLVPGKNKHSHIICDISANDFNHHFVNMSNKTNSKFQNFDDIFFWKGPKSIHSFRFKKMSTEDIKTYLGSLPHKSNNDICYVLTYGWDAVSIFNHLPRMFLSTDFAFRITDWISCHGPHIYMLY